ncbi:putative virion structural protein [Erwinia phage vB_EamM_Huxley]|uniref:Putative virion structural protein n=1 Tax=Erwinia phage vB_EamM_Huxley TaxID=1883373 RepID=A0A1B2ID97_9CAUD|nr:virion structural protein [Erwinia phage vB_EamM_Huxley]ANZ49243.1 putative virion structural protein [Erwinia phage vB_EamM_Huxley]
MGLYDRDSLSLLCRLIMRDNPQLAVALDPTKVMVLSGPFTSGLGTSGRNARITLNGRTGSGIVGKKEFFYDRINLGALFNGITVVFMAAGSAKTYADLLPALNEQYGITLQASDLANGTTKLPQAYTPTQVTLTIASTSPAFTGSLTVTWTRTPVGTFPDSGPGSKVMLIGDMNEGYFGLVSEEELFNAPALHAKINEGNASPVGTVNAIPATRHWYKFARDGKIVYLASYNHINILWRDLYTRGAVYETTVPLNDHKAPASLTRTVQKLAMRKVESGREWYLSPCMPRLSDQTSWDYSAINQTPDPTGDVARLFMKVANAGGYATGEWDVQSIDANGYWQSTASKSDPAKAFGSSMVGWNQGMYDMLTFTGGWRPMLELIDPAVVGLPLENFVGTPEGVLRKPLVTISPDTGDILLLLSDVAWEIQGALKKPQVSMLPSPLLNVREITARVAAETDPLVLDFVTAPLLSVRQTSWQNVLRAPQAQLVAEYKASTVVNLATANGELDGFK